MVFVPKNNHILLVLKSFTPSHMTLCFQSQKILFISHFQFAIYFFVSHLIFMFLIYFYVSNLHCFKCIFPIYILSHGLATVIFELPTGPRRHINPYWQITENSSRTYSKIFIFRVITQAIYWKTHPFEFFVRNHI